MDVWCFPERKTEMRMIRWMCAGFPERKTEMRMIRWMCGVSLKEMLVLEGMANVSMSKKN